MNRDFKGIWIPREIWLAKELSCHEKCLWAEIHSLFDRERGGCYASNEYLCEFFGVQERRLREMISKLKCLGWLQQVSFDGRTRVLKAVVPPEDFKPIPKTAEQTGTFPPVWAAEKCRSGGNETAGPPYNIYPSLETLNIPPSEGDSALAEDLCSCFLKKMKEKKPNFTGTIKKSWLESAKKLLKVRSANEIRKVMDWVFEHEFWKTVVHSPQSLLKGIDKIEMQMASGKTSENRVEENRKWAEDIEEILGSADTSVSSQSISINTGGTHVPNWEVIKFSENGFREQVETKLRKKQLWHLVIQNDS